MRVAYLSVLLISTFGLLVGCQSTNNVVETYKLFQNANSELNTVYLSCDANQGCDFARVDETMVIDEKSRKPSEQAVERGLVRLEGSVFLSKHKYALSLIPGEHEVSVRFFPVSNERAERFHVIHNFMAGHKYNLVMYRHRAMTNSSLLNVALPSALCVDLLQDDIALRRFCRTYDVMTGSGEFVEKSI